MKISIYSTAFNILDKGFNHKDALDHWFVFVIFFLPIADILAGALAAQHALCRGRNISRNRPLYCYCLSHYAGDHLAPQAQRGLLPCTSCLRGGPRGPRGSPGCALHNWPRRQVSLGSKCSPAPRCCPVLPGPIRRAMIA